MTMFLPIAHAGSAVEAALFLAPLAVLAAVQLWLGVRKRRAGGPAGQKKAEPAVEEISDERT